jgi:serine/threonine protein kinase
MASPSREGEILAGKYRLEKLLGRGAVGIIYRAQNTLIGRTVAIKLLRPEHAADEDLVRRFITEARAANMVRHPNVVDVLDIGKDEAGVPFIVEEFLEGEDLARHVQSKGGRLSAAEALEILIPVAEAVGHAHAQGVVHRDLKPENVFLARSDGRVVPKLLDFGLSRIRVAPGEIRATATGMTMGSPAYMSPEQIEGSKDLDARADVWSLGVILFEVLSGRLPFSGDSHVAVFVQITWAEPPKLLQFAPDAPRELGMVVSRCLRRSVDHRYPSAAELARDLRLVREGANIEPTKRHTVSVAPPPPAGLQPQALHRPFAATRVPASATPLPRLTPSRGNPEEHNLIDFGEPGGTHAEPRSGLAIQTMPPRQAPRLRAADGAVTASGEMELSSVLGVMSFIGVAAATAAALMLMLHLPGGWPLFDLAPLWIDGSSPLHAGATVLALAGSGAWLGSVARSRKPVWPLLLSAAGLALAALSIALRIVRLPAPVPTATLAGWSLSLAACGAGLCAFHQAWVCWRAGDRVRALGLVVAATVAWFAAGELLRGTF